MNPRRGMSGPKSQYRGKLRSRPVTILLTDLGHARLAQLSEQLGLSRSDTVEALLRGDARVARDVAPGGRAK